MVRMSGNQTKPVIIYDGQCNFCTAQVDRIRQLDRKHQFEYLARQDPTAEMRFPVLRSIDFNKGMRLMVPNKAGNFVDADIQPNAGVQKKVGADSYSGPGNYAGADAVYQIARRLPVVKAIAWLYCVPGINQLAKLTYAWIAKNRSRFGSTTCTDGSCAIHKGS